MIKMFFKPFGEVPNGTKWKIYLQTELEEENKMAAILFEVLTTGNPM